MQPVSGLQAERLTSNDLSQAHMDAADILAELYANLKEDSILMRQMSTAIWRKVRVLWCIVCICTSLLSETGLVATIRPSITVKPVVVMSTMDGNYSYTIPMQGTFCKC